jgi:hypothetical protein
VKKLAEKPDSFKEMTCRMKCSIHLKSVDRTLLAEHSPKHRREDESIA